MTEKWKIKRRQAEAIREFALIGFWTEADAAEWKSICKSEVDQFSDGGKKTSKTLLDMTRYPNQIQAVQQVHSDCMEYAVSMGWAKSGRVFADVVVKMQMRRLIKHSRSASFENSTTREEPEA